MSMSLYIENISIINVLSLCVFAAFVILVLIRAAMMRKKGIRAIVFGATDKSDFLLVPAILAIAYTVLAKTFHLPIWFPLIRPFWEYAATGWIGLGLCGLALIGCIGALISFGDSFRVGIDEKNPDKLVTAGLFSISRNPIYVCFFLFLIGIFLIHCNIVILVSLVLFVLTIHRQVLREEKFLKNHYGAEYEAYRKKVRRYL
jgi:protein-S-isoprenylcysteine O-methyltransferase Ste14